jgi:polysaccharide export outer membrane protein
MSPLLWAIALAAGGNAAAVGAAPPAATPAGSATPVAAPPTPGAPPTSEQEASELAGFKLPLLQIGPGDSITIQVYGQPDMSGTVYVADNGTIPVALAGPVQVSGLSPAEASARIEQALRDGKFLVDPHVTLTVSESRSQRVSILGQVGRPGRYSIESNMSIFDLLAEAGGITEAGGDIVYVLRPDKEGNVARYRISLKSLADGANLGSVPSLKGGDSVLVPLAPQFYIYGEVANSGKFKVELGMTVIQAIARAGGITQRGSQRRVVIKRRKADGTYETMSAKLSDLVQADDVIRVKESFF